MGPSSGSLYPTRNQNGQPQLRQVTGGFKWAWITRSRKRSWQAAMEARIVEDVQQACRIHCKKRHDSHLKHIPSSGALLGIYCVHLRT
jgi:hypothetical protein